MRAFEEADNMMLTLEAAAATGTSEIMNNVNGDDLNIPGKRDLREFQRGGVTEEELESYKRSRLARDDPMAALLGKDELVG